MDLGISTIPKEKPRPTCINPGCGKPCSYDTKDINGNRNWRIHCSRCQKASYGAVALAEGVTSFKKGECSNKDGHLGFCCSTDFSKWPIKPITEVDHKDGNHVNNDPNNLEELCRNCHVIKGRLTGDFNNQRVLQNTENSKKTALDTIQTQEYKEQTIENIKPDPL